MPRAPQIESQNTGHGQHRHGNTENSTGSFPRPFEFINAECGKVLKHGNQRGKCRDRQEEEEQKRREEEERKQREEEQKLREEEERKRREEEEKRLREEEQKRLEQAEKEAEKLRKEKEQRDLLILICVAGILFTLIFGIWIFRRRRSRF